MKIKGALAIFAVLAVAAWAGFRYWQSAQRPQTARPARPMAAAVQGQGRQSVHLDPPPRPFPSSVPSVTERDRKLLSDLKGIFASKSDNDPRLDTEFRNLSEGTKLLLRQEYATLAPESLNERGTIVFLLGRELKTAQDFAFLSQVGNQPACLSLSDCGKQAPVSDESMHEESTVSVTLTYPQRVALKSLENLLSQGQASSDQTQMALEALGSMTNSPVGWVAQKAADLQTRYSYRH